MADNGMYGTDRRDGEPTQPTKPEQADSVPLAPVMAPRPSSFSRVGENERLLADSLGKASIGLNGYIEKKTKEWELEGQMQYAEGKTEAEVTASGNRYTTAGYMTMKARTAGAAWMQNAVDQINNGGDNQLDSSAYQKKLLDQYQQLSKNVAGNDSFTKELMGSMASDMFPKLVAEQIKSNNTYKEQQTFDSYTGMLLAEGAKSDPEDPTGATKQKTISELLQPGASGLSIERHREAVSKAVTMGLQINDPTLYNAFGVPGKEQVAAMDGTSGLPKGALAYVLNTESGGRRYDKNGNLLTSKEGAKGEMQVLDSTNADPGFGVAPAKDNSPDERARVGRDYLAALTARYNGNFQLGLMAYNAGFQKVDSALQANGDPRTGTVSMQDFINKFPAKETRDYVNGWNKVAGDPAAMSAQADKAATMTTLLKNGFDPSQVVAIDKAFDEYQSHKVNQFDKQRTLTEASIIDNAKSQGNLPAVLDSIQQNMTQYGYGPKWGNEMADKAKTAVSEYEKEHGKIAELQTAISNHSVAQLTGEKQEKAIDIERARISGQYASNTGLTDTQKQDGIRNDMSDMLIQNSVVDTKWKRGINAALTGNIMNPDGTVRKEAMQAYADYQLFSKKANPSYAAKYLEDAKDLVATAEAYDADGMSSEQALKTAADVLSRKQNGTDFNPKVDPVKLKAASDAAVDKLDPGFFNSMTKSQAADFMDVRDNEIEQAKASPIVSSLMNDYAMRAKLRNPNLPDEAAVNSARMELGQRMELVMGNPVVGGKQTSIRQDMGISDDTATNAVGKAMLVFLHDKGGKMWGSKYNEFQWGGDDPNVEGFFSKIGSWLKGAPAATMQSVDDKFRGVPDAMISYDTDRKGFVVDLYGNKERTVLKNDPMFIPAATLGSYYRERVLNPSNTFYQNVMSKVPSAKQVSDTLIPPAQ